MQYLRRVIGRTRIYKIYIREELERPVVEDVESKQRRPFLHGNREIPQKHSCNKDRWVKRKRQAQSQIGEQYQGFDNETRMTRQSEYCQKIETTLGNESSTKRRKAYMGQRKLQKKKTNVQNQNSAVYKYQIYISLNKFIVRCKLPQSNVSVRKLKQNQKLKI